MYREGYYWVKYKHEKRSTWQIAYYYFELDRFELIGMDKFIHPDHFEVHEERILCPL